MSIQNKLLFPLLFGFVSLVSIIHFYWAPNFLENEQSEFINQTNDDLKLIKSDITRHIVSNDFSALFTTLDYVKKVQKNKWEHLTLINSKGKQVYPLFTTLENSLDKDHSKHIPLQLIITVQNSNIATLRLHLNTTEKLKFIKSHILELEVIAISILFFLLLTILFLQHIFIKKPILGLTSAAISISNGKFSTKLPKQGKDQIGQLSHSFDLMRYNILNDQKLLREAAVKASLLAQNADAANQSKGDFLANMSHEIRTPLNAILGISQLLESTGLTSKQLEYVEIINDSGSSLLTIINDILDFSKMEAGKIKIEVKQFNLDKLLNNTAQPFILMAENKGLNFEYSSQVDYPLFMGDPGRIRQVLNNLINNAFKFTENGSIKIKIHTLEKNDTFHQLNFIIQDTGIGISKEQQSKLFKRFNQVDNSTTRKFGGTGLGLSISKQLVELMGGEIHLQSEPSKGSSFSFTLSLKVVLDSEALSTWDSNPTSNIKFNADILLVEDNVTNQIIAKNFISQMGPKVTIAQNGADAINQLKKNNFDLIFMDCQMPVLDGYRATQKIRKTPKEILNNKVKIIAITANAMTGDKDKCLDAGMDGYIAKPITVNELHSIFVNYLSHKRQGGFKMKEQNKIIKKATLPAPQEKNFDFKGLEERLMRDVPLIKEVIDLFLTQTEIELAEISRFIQHKDFKELHNLSHKIKGSSGNIGMMTLSQIANELDNSSKEKDFPSCEVNGKRLTDVFELSKVQALKYLEKLSI
jgi:signal transduction histidine kinase/DNA-binding response OmpR family regulator